MRESLPDWGTDDPYLKAEKQLLNPNMKNFLFFCLTLTHGTDWCVHWAADGSFWLNHLVADVKVETRVWFWRLSIHDLPVWTIARAWSHAESNGALVSAVIMHVRCFIWIIQCDVIIQGSQSATVSPTPTRETFGLCSKIGRILNPKRSHSNSNLSR